MDNTELIPASNIPGVYRFVPPDNLIAGIHACGGVDEYYNYCFEDVQRRMGALYPDNAHEVIERAVTTVQQTRLNIVSDLIAAGLTTPLPDWWAVPSLRRGNIGRAGRAHRTMVPDSRGERFVLQRGGTSWPIFCTWADFSFNVRELAIAERMRSPLDTSHVEQATYLDNEAIEDQAWNGLTDEQGSPMSIDGMTAPGLLSSPTTFDYATWTGLTGPAIVTVVQDAIELLRPTHPGPFTLYIPSNYSKTVTSDYGTAYPKTILARLQELGPWGGRNLEVRISDTLPDNRVVLIQMDRSAVDVIVGQVPTPLSWQDGPKFNTYWIVLACVIFRMFADVEGNYGVAVGDLT